MVTPSTRSWLHQKHEELVPTKVELSSIADALEQVETRMEDVGGQWRIAQRHRCGSFAKKTMLTGRKEADLVVVLSKAPNDQTLDELRDLLAPLTSVQRATLLGKAVKVELWNGVKLDVLPVALEGVTAPSSDVPEKLRHAIAGIQHVEWFITAAHGTPVHPVVRLLKALKAANRTWDGLISFAIEVLAVDVLRGSDGDLAQHFEKVLSRIADGYLEDRRLIDPADPDNDLLKNLGQDRRERIGRAARSALDQLDSGNCSAIFAATASALPSSNIGGRTLA